MWAIWAGRDGHGGACHSENSAHSRNQRAGDGIATLRRSLTGARVHLPKVFERTLQSIALWRSRSARASSAAALHKTDVRSSELKIYLTAEFRIPAGPA